MDNLAENIFIAEDSKKTYTIDEISEVLGISKKSAYALVKSGEFHFVRIGRSIRVSKKVFDKWLEQ